jgi:hypothetical protein
MISLRGRSQSPGSAQNQIETADDLARLFCEVQRLRQQVRDLESDLRRGTFNAGGSEHKGKAAT